MIYKQKTMKCPAKFPDGKVCGAPMVWQNDRERWACTNPYCPDREWLVSLQYLCAIAQRFWRGGDRMGHENHCRV